MYITNKVVYCGIIKTNNMRHFKTKKEAVAHKGNSSVLRVFKKRKGQRNRLEKPFMVGSYIEWLNWE